jgi:uncharacterized protein (DUF1800 family)
MSQDLAKELEMSFPPAGTTVEGKHYDIKNDKIFNKYTNKSLPLSNKKTRSGITPFVGSMTKLLATHLSKRTMFGAKLSDVNSLQAMTPSAAVDALINNVPNPMDTPLNYYQAVYADTAGVPLGGDWTNALYGDGTDNYYRMLSYKAMWIKAMTTQNISLQEKMTLCLHNFLPIGSGVVGDARFEYKYLQLIRQYALGNYKDLVREITKDGAMLYYLNGYINNKFSPDENYARELQELFTVGKDGGQQYLEADVITAAKLLTGWRINGTNVTTFFDPAYHDTSNKTFSAFYNNATVTGSSAANAGDLELDAFLNIIFSGQSGLTTAKHVCRNIYRYFMHYDIDASIETNIITPLAQTFIASNWELKPVLSQLFKSAHFFDTLNIGAQIKNPFDLYIGTIRTLGVEVNPSANIQDYYNSYLRAFNITNSLGMELGDPPNVSGWKAYYQVPSYHELWINSDTYPKRLRFSDRIVSNNGYYVSANVKYVADLLAFAQSLTNPADPDALINEVILLLYGIDVSTATKDIFKKYLLNNQAANTYWTTAWNNFIANPNDPTAMSVVINRLRPLLIDIMRKPEFHLS